MSLRRIDLNLFRVFEAVMEHRTIAGAGRELNVTASAVSHALSRLRQALSDDLFVPGKDGMEPTQRALELATWLEQQPQVSRVYYPGLASHPQHALAMAQQSGKGGAVVSFDLRAADAQQARARAFQLLDTTRTIGLCTNLGDVKSLLSHPASTSHGRLTEAQRQVAGIGQGLVRLAVGLEHVGDLQADLLHGFAALK